jgi:hypothetical protein
MALQLSTALRNARANAIASTVGTAPILRIYTGTQPADCATAASGSLLVSVTCPSSWLGSASAGVVSGAGLPWAANASATGTAGYYRIYDSAGTTCHEQGNIATSGADMNVDNTSFASGQTFSVTSFSKTEANA